jgi:hypothetical protein
MELTSCPECGATAAIEERHVMESTDGPVEHAKVRCVTGHGFFLPVAALEARVVRREAARPAPARRR